MRRTILGIVGCLSMWAAVAGDPEPVRDTYTGLDELPPPPRMTGVGNSHLAITTDSELAQQYFDQGVSLLHDFWEFEAYRAFRRAAELDPNAPMPWWGMYMAAGNLKRPGASDEPSFREAEALERMRALRENASEREKYYIRAVEHLADDGEDAYDDYQAELEALLNKYPDETEAALFLALSKMSGFDRDGNPNDGQMYAEALLEGLLATDPDHQGLLHYWIHAQEPGERPDRALDAAQRLADLAPDAGHIVHMPGHIYFIMGDYPSARAQFERAEAVGRRYMTEQDISVIDTWNYIHNLNFLVASVAEEGRYADGMRWATSIETVELDASHRFVYGLDNYYLQGLTMPARVDARFARWDDAADRLAALPVDEEPWGPQLLTYREALLAFARGRAALDEGDHAGAQREADRLDATLFRAQQSDTPLSPFRSKPLRVASLDLRGSIAAAGGDIDGAVELLQEAVEIEAGMGYHEPPMVFRPALHTLGDIKLAAGRWQDAREAYEGLLAIRPNSGHALYGIARSYELAGDDARAKEAFERFLEAWQTADPDLPQLDHAKRYLVSDTKL